MSPDATRKHHPLSRLAADARYAAGHRSEPQTAADTWMALNTSLATDVDHQPSERKIVPEPADGQWEGRNECGVGGDFVI